MSIISRFGFNKFGRLTRMQSNLVRSSNLSLTCSFNFFLLVVVTVHVSILHYTFPLVPRWEPALQPNIFGLYVSGNFCPCANFNLVASETLLAFGGLDLKS